MSSKILNLLERSFKRKRIQYEVATFLLRSGVRVKDNGKLAVLAEKEVELPLSSVAKAMGVDRRVVKETVQRILSSPELRRVYRGLRISLMLKEIAEDLGYGVLEIIPTDAKKKGILAGLTKIIADAGISVRQIVCDDPMFEDARTIIITERPLPKELIEDILRVEGVKEVLVRH